MHVPFCLRFPEKRVLRGDSCASLLGNVLGINTREGVREAGLGRRSSWAVMHWNQAPHMVLWSWSRMALQS